MSNTDKIMLECTNCGRKKRVSRDLSDPPGSALMQTQCDRCNRGNYTPEFYFDAQGREINCDGELLPSRPMRPEMAIIAISSIVVGLLVYYVAI